MKKTYKICHSYDGADKPAYVASRYSPVCEAVYCQFVAENHYGVSASVLNAGVARALVEQYGCEALKPSQDAIRIDMYTEREYVWRWLPRTDG